MTSDFDRYLTGSLAPNPLITRIFVITRSKSVYMYLDIVFLLQANFGFGDHFEKNVIFDPPFWIKVEDVEC